MRIVVSEERSGFFIVIEKKDVNDTIEKTPINESKNDSIERIKGGALKISVNIVASEMKYIPANMALQLNAANILEI